MSKVLLVDDNETNRELLSRRLGRRGWQVNMAADGQHALDAIALSHPDVILMDVALPDIGGLEVVRRLKADLSTQPIPVIALTAHAMPEDRREAEAAGCNAFATKPVDFDVLLGIMKELVGGEA